MINQKEAAAGNRIPVELQLFRIIVSALLAAHGWARLLAGGVAPFGEFLEAQGFPLGLQIAWAITLLEIVGTILVIFGSRYTSILCAVFAAIYTAGIVLVHASEGWFVVGLGRNGMEYSVLLISSLLLVAYCHLPPAAHSRLKKALKITDN